MDALRAEHLDRQLEAVIRQQVSFYRRRVMNRGEYDLFRAAMGVTGQQLPGGAFPFYVFPQVSLGQIIGTQDPGKPESEAAYRAINSKRCDLLLADRSGNPVAVLEFQGSRRDTAHHPRANWPASNPRRRQPSQDLAPPWFTLWREAPGDFFRPPIIPASERPCRVARRRLKIDSAPAARKSSLVRFRPFPVGESSPRQNDSPAATVKK